MKLTPILTFIIGLSVVGVDSYAICRLVLDAEALNDSSVLPVDGMQAVEGVPLRPEQVILYKLHQEVWGVRQSLKGQEF